MTLTSQVFVTDTCALGEGPFWLKERLWWVDIEGCALHSVDGNAENRWSFSLGQRIGSAAPLAAGGFIVALEEGIGTFDPANGQVEILHSPEFGVEGSRFNDGKCDARGRFLAGTLSMTGRKKASALYSFNQRGVLEKLYAPVTCSNGLAWSADGRTLYYIDTPTQEIASFSYDLRTGQIGNRTIVVKVPEAMGYPDGMCIDTGGNLWVALWGGAAVCCWSPITGECLAKISVPCSQPTSCCFGGPDLSRLFITSARIGDEAHPLAGSVFVCDTGARGFGVQHCEFERGPN